ncbi:PTS sugar transporter subunit IIC [Brevibacillus laterosporus]|uniref:PTS sugar transporter subunit IIC n=1 Tax=Brevibacillus laterosporus TaxID=1465 RepID=UPI002652276D|nr:PTS transporter subunit EIIC [Brevibacillus laterosporus]MDN9011994.1 PTS transporter subunit EIIC [Brevibacillus laterosporus]MDO0943090.1 PTS transporter subunit EIIC [Brevibacillus laterosporus]
MMEKIMTFMNESFSPRVNKITKNPWVSSIQDAVMTILPLILVGSLITIVSLLNSVFSWLPDFSLINTFTFGLLGLFVSFLIPYFIMEKKKLDNKKLIAGSTGLALYLFLLSPVILENGQIQFMLDRFGATGMFLSLIVGLFVGFVLVQFSKFSFFSADSSIPDFIVVWFDTLIPITLIMLTGWLIGVQAKIDFFEVILAIFKPLSNIVQSYPGFVLSVFIPAFLYTFGISGWVMMPVIYPVYLSGLAENAQVVASGGTPSNIAVMETLYAFTSMGGIGTTLPLVIMMFFLGKSMRMKAIGQATIVPSIFNINEPLMFGAPIVFNPFLMIPMWITAIVIPSITYWVLHAGWVSIPTKTFMLWYLPMPISSYLATQDWRAIVLAMILFLVAFIIFFPFFKAYDIQERKKELEVSESEQ